MPNWKKLIVSGSSASLNDLTVATTVTASSFSGDGSGLTNISTDVAEVATVTDTFTSVTSKIVSHNFNTKNVLVIVYNDSDEQILPSLITTNTANQVTVSFDANTSGRVVVAKGGHIVSGSAQNSDLLQSEPGSYYLNYSNFTSIPGGLISGSAQIVTLTRYEQDISGSTQYTITHGLNEDYPLVQIYDTSKVQVLPGEIKATNSSTVELTFDSNFTGKVVVKK
jgi:hypothetical protein